MNRTESDLREALRELERRADRAGGPSAPDLLADVQTADAGRHRRSGADRPSRARWLAPLAAAVVVAGAAGGIVAVVSSDGGGSHSAGGAPSPSISTPPRATPSASTPSGTPSTSAAKPSPSRTAPGSTSAPGEVLADAAGRLGANTSWHAPASDKFFYTRTTDTTTWTSVSGRQSGKATGVGGRGWVPGCRHGQYTAGSGQEGSCTLNDVGHYRADAPTTPDAWDAYLERIAPGAKAAGAQGKIIVQVLHGDLISPHAAAALLRYTETCPGLKTVTTKPVAGHSLVGVTCTSMAAGSYGLAFDARTHEFAGFVPVESDGTQSDTAEVVLQTGIVSAVGQKP